MKGKVGIIVILVMIGYIGSLASFNNVEADDIAQTLIHGSIDDSVTGSPVENVYISVYNHSRDLHFYYYTEVDGYYEINVGTTGNFTINIDGPAHHFKTEDISINLFDEIEVDFQIERYEHDVMIYFCNQDEIYPLEDLEVTITDELGSGTTHHTSSNGWLNISLEYGNYSMKTHRDHLETYEVDFNVSQNKVFLRTKYLRPNNVYENASKKLDSIPITIPPNEFRAIRIIDQEPTELWLRFSSNEEITWIEMTQRMYDKYLAIHTGIPYTHDEEPCIDYDGKFGSYYRGGGTVSAWRIPYYIVFENNNTESSDVEFDLYYEYGEPYIASILEGPLEPTVIEDEGDEPSSLESSSLGIVILSIFLFAVTIMTMKRRKWSISES